MDEVYWSYSFTDLTTLVSLKSQEQMAHHLQTYETFRLVVDEALGGGESRPAESSAIQTFDELAKAFSDIGGSLG
ncbi:hypothetical protein ASG58_21005 [Rhizobium sp. Leaf383]|nr:hypothetical protein ASG58_21005 [Rhizobium sp. Leaf383]